MRALVEEIDALLPQTQCQRCGYEGCWPYAEAMAEGSAPINRCPPGGVRTVVELARLLRREPEPLDPGCGVFEGFRLAVIDEQWCVGCTICIQKCPVDAIVGAHKLMHTVVAGYCTGCELCVQPCPTGCIEMVPVASHPNRDRLGESWTTRQGAEARRRYRRHQERVETQATDNRQTKRRRRLRHASRRQKRLAIEAAVQRAQSRTP